ncbi:hypothetical protein LBMAG46_21930 [Planctomycetia bacterium]|nr:hypothetical protein LBMAG46_21930 [Planctomycetia bacterium]
MFFSFIAASYFSEIPGADMAAAPAKVLQAVPNCCYVRLCSEHLNRRPGDSQTVEWRSWRGNSVTFHVKRGVLQELCRRNWE